MVCHVYVTDLRSFSWFFLSGGQRWALLFLLPKALWVLPHERKRSRQGQSAATRVVHCFAYWIPRFPRSVSSRLWPFQLPYPPWKELKVAKFHDQVCKGLHLILGLDSLENISWKSKFRFTYLICLQNAKEADRMEKKVKVIFSWPFGIMYFARLPFQKNTRLNRTSMVKICLAIIWVICTVYLYDTLRLKWGGFKFGKNNSVSQYSVSLQNNNLCPLQH